MKTRKLILLTIAGSLLSPFPIWALVRTNGSGGGDWSDAWIWVDSIPACGDSILVQNGDTSVINVQQDYSACANPMYLEIAGTLFFPDNGAKLKLPAGSVIIVNAGGMITAPGNGNGNKISIGTEWVWEKLDSDVTGPSCFGACQPLPVVFAEVDASLAGSVVFISWQTLSESNNDHFTVERSADGSDFTAIAKVAGAGTSNEPLMYQVQDPEPLYGLSYYRIRQTDYDGSYQYSRIAAVWMDGPLKPDISVYPNPVERTEGLFVDFSGGEISSDALIEIRDMEGRITYSQTMRIMGDTPETILLTAGNTLSTGVYHILILAGSETVAKMLVVR